MNGLRTIQREIYSAWAHKGLQRYFFNTGWMFAEKVLRMISGIFIGVLVARHLQPANYGLLNYALSLVALFTVFSTLGLEAIVIRELVKGERKENEILGTSITLRLVAVVVVIIVLFTFTFLSSTDQLTNNLIYIIAIGSLFEVTGVIDYFFQSHVASRYTVISQVIALVGISIFRVVLVFIDAPLIWFAWTTTIDAALIALGLLFFYHKNGNVMSAWRFTWSSARLLLSDSWPFIFQSLAITVYMKIDQLMVKWMLGNAATGNYGVAVRLSELWNFIPMAVCASVLPAILNARLRNKELYENRVQLLYDLMVAMAICIAIPFTFFGDWIVGIMFGEAYAEAGTLLTLYIWSGVFIFLGIANGKWIISENLQVLRMYSLVVAAIMNIILNYFLIEMIGLHGAALSTLISYSFAYYFSLAIHKKTRPAFVASSRALNIIGSVRRLRDAGKLWNT
jgi:O-antigen/teichoic acid export membrane protein